VSGTPEVLVASDQGVLVRFGAKIDPEIHAKVRGLVAAVDLERPSWLVDVVPAYAAVLVSFDPLAIGVEEVKGWLVTQLAHAGGSDQPSRRLQVPVWYDPAVAPDLEEVARLRCLSVDEVIEIHASREYLVYMLGFKPGFPYMAEVDERLATPRLAAPRLAVPVGSVAIAGRQTGIYPVTCPGGWRVIGRTPLSLFDPNREQPFLFRTGDHVRFVRVGQARFREIEADQGSWKEVAQ